MNGLVERCAATACPRDSDVWAYSPRARGLVRSCIAHALDVTCGATTLREDATVLERGRCVA